MRRPSLVAQAPVHADHRELDDVRRGALDHGVDREPLAERAHLPVRRPQLGDRPATAEHRHRVAALARLLDRARDPLGDARHASAVGVDVRLRLLAGDVELVGQPEARDAVDDAEVDGLRAVALVARELGLVLSEHLRRRHRVDVVAARERVEQQLLAREVREDAQLDLRVVGRHEPRAVRGDERLADLAADLGPRPGCSAGSGGSPRAGRSPPSSARTSCGAGRRRRSARGTGRR